MSCVVHHSEHCTYVHIRVVPIFFLVQETIAEIGSFEDIILEWKRTSYLFSISRMRATLSRSNSLFCKKLWYSCNLLHKSPSLIITNIVTYMYKTRSKISVFFYSFFLFLRKMAVEFDFIFINDFNFVFNYEKYKLFQIFEDSLVFFRI